MITHPSHPSARSGLRALALAGLLSAGLAGAGGAAEIRVGEPFPEIVLPTLDGEMRSIADFRGKKVVLHVFASW